MTEKEKKVAELREQKREIEKQLREMNDKDTIFGRVRLRREHHRGFYRNDVILSIRSRDAVSIDDREGRWNMIMRLNERKDALLYLDDLIADLMNLRDHLESEEE